MRTIDLMHDQVRAIYRATTGAGLEEVDRVEGEARELEFDEVELRFADLQALARGNPAIAQRVPPFSFQPLIDLLESEKEWVVEAVVPGVDPQDLAVEVDGDLLTVSGARRVSDCTYLQAEAPRGPFSRTIRLPANATQEPVVESRQGVVSIHFAKPASDSATREKQPEPEEPRGEEQSMRSEG